MKRMVGLLLALCTLLSMTAAGAEEYFTYGYILGDDAAAVVMYAQADADSEMVGCLLPGTPVTIIGIRFEKDEEWACIHADHEEREDQVLGYVRREQVGAAAPEVKLVTATLRVLGDPADTLDLNSDAGNILLVVVPTGTKAWVWGMMGERYIVQVPEVGGSGTVEMAYVELAEEDQQRMDAVIPEAYNQQYEEQRMAYAAMEAYYNETAAVYGANTEEWPVEQRAAYCSLNEAAKIYPAWVDLQPRAEDMTQEAARARALQLFQELWNLDATKDDWRVAMAYGYNRMEPKVRLWQVTFRRHVGADEQYFRMQLTAEDGICYRTSSEVTFARQLMAEGHTVDEALDAWEKRLGRKYWDWTLEEQYEFNQLPIIQIYDTYFAEAATPAPGDLTQEEAASCAKLAIIQRYGIEEAELDALKLEVQGMYEKNYADTCYVFYWRERVENEEIGNLVYMAYVSMATGEVYGMSSPDEGNG